MKRSLTLVCLLVTVMAVSFCGLSAAYAAEGSTVGLNLVPWPRSITMGSGSMPLTAAGRIVAADDSLQPLAKILSDEIFVTQSVRMAVTKDAPKAGDIILQLDKKLPHEDYTLKVTDKAVVTGANYNAAAMGTVTLLQAIVSQKGKASLPQMTVADGPKLEYCGTMLDIARKPYSIDTLKRCVDAARFYKIRYIHLHMSDENAWTFPSKAFPKLGSTNEAWAGGSKCEVYNIDELKALVAYGDARGVTFVPELETPGHSGALRGSLPEIFGYKNEQGQVEGAGIINIASDEAYGALDTLIGEFCEVFKSTPYFHVGCDEASAGGIEKYPAVKALMEKEGLKNGHEVFNYFVHRMDAMVKKHGKRTIVWQGAPNEPKPLPKDVLWMPWVGDTGFADYLVKNGYSVINPPWGTKKPYMDVYNVNGAQLKHGEPLLIGATSILWQAPSDQALPYIRYTGALRNEPTYNPDCGKEYVEFLKRQQSTDRMLDRVLYGFGFDSTGLVDSSVNLSVNPMFDKTATLNLASSYPTGSVRYTVDGTEPAATSPVLSAPITLAKTTTIKARWFSPDGKTTSPLYSQEFIKLPAVKHDAVGAKVTMTPEQPGYFGPGPKGLTDGLLSPSNNYTVPGWVGWQGNGTITLDLGKATRLKSVTAHFLRSGGGVDLPKSVEFEASNDGKAFTKIAAVDYVAGCDIRGWFRATTENVTARYLRLNVAAKGEWIFTDEVMVNGELPGPDITHEALHKPVTFATEPNGYTMPGAKGMTDGYVSHESNFQSPEWLGWEGRNIEATVDMGQPTAIHEVSAHFGQNIWAGIRIPNRVEVLVSNDGKEFTKVATVDHEKNEIGENTEIVSAKLTNAKARYVKIVAYTNGQWLFLDEILINPKAEK